MRISLIKLVSLAVLLHGSGRGSAQVDPAPKDGRVTVQVTLSPNDYLKPASRCYLLPEFGESIPGNRVQMFLRCFMEQDNFFGREETARRSAWNEMPLKDLPAGELKNYGGRLLERDMYDAARMTNTDWQLWSFVRRDGFSTLLPDVQKMRSLASALQTRIRGEVAAGDYEGAIHTVKTLFGLGRTFEAHPTLIGHLVGVAITTIAVNTLEEFIQQPASPNLYWALTDLPTPFLSLRAPAEGERMIVSADFELLKTAADPVADSAILKKIEKYEQLFKSEGKSTNPIRDLLDSPKVQLAARSKDSDEVKAARDRLIQAGLKPQHVNVWSPLHVVLIDDVVLYEQYRDELGKWLNLPHWQAMPGMTETEAQLTPLKGRLPFLALISAAIKVKTAQTRLDQRLAYLRILEAIRLHAHKNGGALPMTLAEMKLPLPVDPVTGKPFEYVVKDGVAGLHGANPLPGQERTNRYYEIRIQK